MGTHVCNEEDAMNFESDDGIRNWYESTNENAIMCLDDINQIEFAGNIYTDRC